jgi:hypothetical protein
MCVSDPVSSSEVILAQLQRLDDAEDTRQERSNSKLSSILAIIPIVATLASSIVISSPKDTSFAVSPLGRLVEVLVVCGVLTFLIAARDAMRGLDPIRARYKVLDPEEIAKYAGVDVEKLRSYLITELRNLLPYNEKINSRKFTDYRRAYQKVMLGMLFLIAGLLLTVSAQLLSSR